MWSSHPTPIFPNPAAWPLKLSFHSLNTWLVLFPSLLPCFRFLRCVPGLLSSISLVPSCFSGMHPSLLCLRFLGRVMFPSPSCFRGDIVSCSQLVCFRHLFVCSRFLLVPFYCLRLLRCAPGWALIPLSYISLLFSLASAACTLWFLLPYPFLRSLALYSFTFLLLSFLGSISFILFVF